MSMHECSLARLRTRWSAIGAAVAITLGAGGIGFAQAAVDSSDKPVTVTVDAKRVVDTRTNLGLAGAFAKDTPREVQITGSVDVATATGTAKETVVPAGASAVLVNVTVVTPTDLGFLTLRAGGAAGAPSTSTVNFLAGSFEPNAATVDLSADGKIQVWVFMPNAAARADVLIDVVGYTVDHNHDDRYYTEGESNARYYQKAEVDAAVAALHGDIVGLTSRVAALEGVKPLFAEVLGDGVLLSGSRVVSVVRPSTGVYNVKFDRNVQDCAYTATIGSNSGEAAGLIDTVLAANDTVRVITESNDGVPPPFQDRAFHLVVTCG